MKFVIYYAQQDKRNQALFTWIVLMLLMLGLDIPFS